MELGVGDGTEVGTVLVTLPPPPGAVGGWVVLHRLILLVGEMPRAKGVVRPWLG